MTTSTPDLKAVTTAQQAMWASGDFAVIAHGVHAVAERLVDSADPIAGCDVLDVATGSGNAAIAAARYGCKVTGLDYVPALLERGRERAAAERLAVTFVEGDAQALPFDDASFDLVVSVFGVMFAPNQAQAASELVRVCRPGGRIVTACWQPTGFVGEQFKLVARHAPPPPGVASPLTWGDPEAQRALFGDRIAAFTSETRICSIRSPSFDTWFEVFSTWFGPMVRAVKMAEDPAALKEDLRALAARFDRHKDIEPMALDSEYLVAEAVRA